MLLLGPPGVGHSHLCQAIGYAVIKSGFSVLYRSIFDLVRDFLHDGPAGAFHPPTAAFEGENKVLARSRKPDLLIVDDMGMKHLPKRSGEYLFAVIMRRYETRSTMIDVQQTPGRLGQMGTDRRLVRRRSVRHGHPRPLPAPCRTDPDHRQKLPPAKPRQCRAGWERYKARQEGQNRPDHPSGGARPPGRVGRLDQKELLATSPTTAQSAMTSDRRGGCFYSYKRRKRMTPAKRSHAETRQHDLPFIAKKGYITLNIHTAVGFEVPTSGRF